MSSTLAARSPQPGQLQPPCSARSAATAATFVAAFPAGKLDPVGLPPVPKVLIRPPSSKRPKKRSALDKHVRHVVLLQRSNRHKADLHAVNAQARQQHRQRFAAWSHKLRCAILHRDCSPTGQQSSLDAASNAGDSPGPLCSPTAHSSNSPGPKYTTAASTAPAAELQQDLATTAHGHTSSPTAGVLQSWKPVAAAAQMQRLQEAIAVQQQQLLHAPDQDVLRPDHRQAHQQQQQHPTGSLQPANKQPTKPAGQQQTAQDAAVSPANAAPKGAAATTAQADLLDVDAFLDSLLHSPPAATAGSPGCTLPADGSASKSRQAAPSSMPQQKQQQSGVAAAAASIPCQRDGSKGRPVPAWALSQQQLEEQEAQQQEQEEQELLEFSQQLDWQQLLQDLNDDELAAAFKELDLAGSAEAQGDADADKRWRRCFVTALNAAAMRGIAASGTEGPHAGAAPGSHSGNRHSHISSASALRRAEAAAARRTQLLHRLHRLTGAPLPPSAAPGAAAASLPAPSVCGSSSRCQVLPGVLQQEPLWALAPADAWDSSMVVSGSGCEVGRLKAAIKHLEAGEVLAENPEMRAVHSTASVRGLLSKLEPAV